MRPFNPNRFHYKWHWNWDYGTGELGNNGIHALDVARMMLGLDAPLRITAGGGKYFYDDDQQTPDTIVAAFDFPGTCVTWEHRIWSKAAGDDGWITLYGEKGTLVFDRNGWHVTDGMPRYEVMHLEIQPSARVATCEPGKKCKPVLYAATHSQGIWRMKLK